MKNEPLKNMSFAFALKVIALSETLNIKQNYILSKQILRSGTAVGALIVEAKNAESPRDFVHKLHIAQKECAESIYWLELLLKSDKIDLSVFDELFDIAKQLLKMINSSIMTVKQKNQL